MKIADFYNGLKRSLKKIRDFKKKPEHIDSDLFVKTAKLAVSILKEEREETRPRNNKSNPGGLIKLKKGVKSVIIPDLHGRKDDLVRILGKYLNDLEKRKIVLVFLGDAVHPEEIHRMAGGEYGTSLEVLETIMSLKAHYPENIHYLLGNHDDNWLACGIFGGCYKGWVNQTKGFYRYVIKYYGKEAYREYVEFIENCPVAVMGENFLVVHAGVPKGGIIEKELVNFDHKKRYKNGRKEQQLLWNRASLGDYSGYDVNKTLENLFGMEKSKKAKLIVGHEGGEYTHRIPDDIENNIILGFRGGELGIAMVNNGGIKIEPLEVFGFDSDDAYR